MCISGLSGSSYGADIPVKSVTMSILFDQRSNGIFNRKHIVTFEFTSTSFLVQSLGVPTLYYIQRRVNENLYERDSGFLM
jgi:hypothetical protein